MPELRRKQSGIRSYVVFAIVVILFIAYHQMSNLKYKENTDEDRIESKVKTVVKNVIALENGKLEVSNNSPTCNFPTRL